MKRLSLILADEDQKVIDEMKDYFTNEEFEILATTNSGDELIKLINKWQTKRDIYNP